MTFGQIRLMATKYGENVDLDNLDQFIQDRYQVILDAAPWKALDKAASLTLTVGTVGTPAIYPLPADCKILLEMNNTAGNFPMRPYTQAELNLVFPARLDTGPPSIYSMASDTVGPPPLHQVEVYPVPSATGTLPYRYTQIAANFDPTQTTLSPLPWVPSKTILDGVRADILALAKDYAGMEAFENLFTAGINQMLRVEGYKQPNVRMAEEARYQGAATFPGAK